MSALALTREYLDGRDSEDLRRIASWAHSILAGRENAEREIARQVRKADPNRLGCQADGDDECEWNFCPQLRDGEPAKTGRHCPKDIREDDE